jgi:hypothetical protein
MKRKKSRAAAAVVSVPVADVGDRLVRRRINSRRDPYMIGSEDFRYSLWVVFTDRGQVLRGGYADKNVAIEDAKKYWLTNTGLFRAFVRDKESGNAIIYDRAYSQRQTKRGERNG